MSDYTATGRPLQGARGISKRVREEFELIETAVNSKADIDSEALTGVPTAPTATLGTSTTQIATTEFVSNTSFSTNLPGQTSNGGKLLTTDGTNASWTDELSIAFSLISNSPINHTRTTVSSHATTADIWDAGNEIDFTGSETITDFPAAPQAGASRVLHIADSPTFTHNANIFCPKNVDYIANAGDVITIHAITTTTFRIEVPGAFKIDTQEFLSSGTWNKMDNANLALIMCWGGGGGGANDNGTTHAGGGSGGEFTWRMMLASDLSVTETVTIGAGGLGKRSSAGDGASGGNTTFGSHLTAIGGRGGRRSNIFATIPRSIESNLPPATSEFLLYTTSIQAGHGAANGGDPGGSTLYGGAGGGAASGTGASLGGTSMLGGDGGGGVGGSSPGPGGLPGSVPGGGGGGSYPGNDGGDGGDGKCIVFQW